jgi:hypothetical protein
MQAQAMLLIDECKQSISCRWGESARFKRSTPQRTICRRRPQIPEASLDPPTFCCFSICQYTLAHRGTTYPRSKTTVPEICLNIASSALPTRRWSAAPFSNSAPVPEPLPSSCRPIGQSHREGEIDFNVFSWRYGGPRLRSCGPCEQQTEDQTDQG